MIYGTVPFVLDILPCNHFDNEDDFKSVIMEGILNDKFHMNEMSNKLFFSFEINQGIETPHTEMDPDIQFYSDCHYIKNLNCNYYLEENFKTKLKIAQQQEFIHPSFTLTSKVCPNITTNL